MAMQQIHKQIEDIKASLNKKYEAAQKAAPYTNDIEHRHHSPHTITTHRNVSNSSSPNIKNTQSPSTKPSDFTILRLMDLDCEDCSDQTKWTWLYILSKICRYLTYFFIAVIIVCIIIIAAKKTYHGETNNINSNQHSMDSVDILNLLKQTVGKSMLSLFLWNEENRNENEHQKISTIQALDSSTIFLKISDDDQMHFVAFRKPLKSACSQKEFSFHRDCVNVHNVRDVQFHAKNKELEFLIAGSYPRLIEIHENTTIILNDRLFEISKNGQTLSEITNATFYRDGQEFCKNNLVFVNDDGGNNKKGNSIIISGHCYGVLYLPLSQFWENSEVKLLASQWSSIIVDTDMNEIDLVIIALNNEASIIFRAPLMSQMVNAAVTDNAYVEFKQISEADVVSMITLHGSQIYIPLLKQCKSVFLQSTNHSLMEVMNVVEVDEIHLFLMHFSHIRMPNIEDTQSLMFKREKNTQILLPNPYGNIGDDKRLEDAVSFN